MKQHLNKNAESLIATFNNCLNYGYENEFEKIERRDGFIPFCDFGLKHLGFISFTKANYIKFADEKLTDAFKKAFQRQIENCNGCFDEQTDGDYDEYELNWMDECYIEFGLAFKYFKKGNLNSLNNECNNIEIVVWWSIEGEPKTYSEKLLLFEAPKIADLPKIISASKVFFQTFLDDVGCDQLDKY